MNAGRRAMPDTEPPARTRVLTLASGGWVLILAGVLTMLIIAWQVGLVLTRHGPPRRGDGRTVESYGFDLGSALVPLSSLAASGMPVDGLVAIDAPSTYTLAEFDALSSRERKFLKPADRVVGVEIAGEARAYPVRILNWHEVVNDTLGDVPIAVTYSPLSDSVVVFDRHFGGATVDLGVSGLLYDSHHLLYDRRPSAGEESLISQLEFRAVAGPRAGTPLTVVPSQLVRWDVWREQYPATTVLAPNPQLYKRYQGDPYVSYYGSDRLRFPAAPLPADGAPLKTRVVAVGIGAEHRVYALADLLGRAGGDGVVTDTLGGTEIRLAVRADPLTVEVTRSDGAPVDWTAHAFWFAWYSTHPGEVLAR